MPAKSKNKQQTANQKKVPQRPGQKCPVKILKQAEGRKSQNKPVKCDHRGCGK